MSNQLQLSGAQPIKQTRYTPLWNETFASGLVTQRNPLRAGSGNALLNRLYGGRNDAFLDGLNVEISNRLTPVRRPGSSVYNSQTFPAIDNFYEFRLFNPNTETIKVMADTASIIYDATGPSTKTSLFTKSTGAGEAYFQSVGNTLYWGDGVDQNKWVQSPLIWKATTLFNAQDFIVDTNGNLQVAVGSQTFTANFVAGTGFGFKLQFLPDGILPIARFLTGVSLTFAGFVNQTALNGETEPIVSIQGANLSLVPGASSFSTVQFTFATGGAGVGAGDDSGTATTGNGITGATQPTWATGLGAVTIDAGQQWINHGPAVELWGIIGPTTAPLVSQQPVNTSDVSWVASVYFPSAGGFVAGPYPDQNGLAQPILDGSGNVQFISRTVTVGAPITGASLPAFSGTPGVSVNDGNIIWTCQGPSTPSLSHAYTLGQWVNAVATDGNSYFFRCTKPGISGATAPSWLPAYGFIVQDGAATWENQGPPFDWSRIGPTQVVSGQIEILDSNGNRETTVISGVSGSTAPTWSTVQGSDTTDNTVKWLNDGPLSPASTLPWVWAYAYKNSVTGNVSSASPVSTPITQTLNNYEIIQGQSSTDPQVDTVVLYRSVQGGSTATLLFLDEIPNIPGKMWVYFDNTPDTGLDNELLANISPFGNPPPVGLVKMTYHLGRIWGVVNNSVYFSAGPDSTDGNGNEQFPPANVFVFPDEVNRLWATSQGLFVFTVADVYLISGITTSTFFSVPFLYGVGLQNYNAWAVNGATVYIFSSDYQLLSMDMSSGVSEVGFPIGDQFIQMSTAGLTTSIYNPNTARLTWHIAGSPDKGLYVSDFNTGWFRLYPTPAPETGLTWAPFAAIVNGVSQVQSVETSPGIHNLLIAPHTSGPILMRNSSVFTDNGLTYDANFVFGSIVLAQPGQLAELVFITTDSIATGTTPSLAVQLDELFAFAEGGFENLPAFGPDPPQLEPSTSMFSQRFYLSQTQQPAVCRSLQIRVDWRVDTVQNELLSLTLFGGYSSEL